MDKPFKEMVSFPEEIDVVYELTVRDETFTVLAVQRPTETKLTVLGHNRPYGWTKRQPRDRFTGWRLASGIMWVKPQARDIFAGTRPSTSWHHYSRHFHDAPF